MDNSTKFTVTVEIINRMIAQLNIKICENPDDINLKNSLNKLLDDKKILYTGNAKELEKIISKYGERN